MKLIVFADLFCNFICVGGRHAPRERLLFWNEGCWVLWCWLGLICGCCTVWPLPCELRCIFVICVLNVEQKMYVANRGNEWKYVNLTAAYFRYQVISPLRLPPQRWVINPRLWYKTRENLDRLICVFAGSFINAILSPRILSKKSMFANATCNTTLLSQSLVRVPRKLIS